MEKTSENYTHTESGITFQVIYTKEYLTAEHSTVYTVKKLIILPSGHNSGYKDAKNSFVFSHSKPETVNIIGKSLVEISEFVETL